MAQKTINVGTVANDGTGDTVRGAFTNVNANFTEVYSNVASLDAVNSTQNTTISRSYVTANAAYDLANVIFASQNTDYGVANNAYLTANLAYANANAVSIGANTWANTVGFSGNTWANTVGAASNTWANTVGTASNNYAIVMDAAGNNYTNAVGTAGNNWTQSTFQTISNVSLIFNTTNAAYTLANTALQNTSGTLIGSLLATGGFSDTIGPVREKRTYTVNSNTIIVGSETIVIANNSNGIYVNIDNDGNFVFPANVGTKIEVYQYGSGNTSIRPNSTAVTIVSSNNWANISGQYLSVTLVKVKANTWLLKGDLKA